VSDAGAPRPPGPFRLAALLVRFRLRTLRNGLRARQSGRYPALVLTVGLLTSLAYVGLFSQAFAAIVAATNLAGQTAALALVAGTIAFGSLTAKASSSEAVLAGSPENEFLLARPVSLPTLVVARCLAEAVTDPLGALFLFPVLLAAALIWGLSGFAWAVAAASSVATQLAISALAQATQVAVARLVPRRRRRAAWMALRLLASLALATLWMMGTWVLRAPDALARALRPLEPMAGVSPGALIVAPLAAAASGAGAVTIALLLIRVAAAGAAALLLAAIVARRASARGWEEASASWSEAAHGPPRAAPGRRPRRPITAANKDLRLITRDRAQLLALLALPVIFVGVQLFGAAGWSWSTANLMRVACLVFSLTLYMATIGPLAHMQAERRAFWILRTVPVPIGSLLAAKARAWSVLVGGIAAAAFTGLSFGAPFPGLAEWLETALLVVGGAVGMTWLAVALATRAADLSDDQRPAIGPATIYVFLLVGGLYNVMIVGDAPTRALGGALYLFVLGAYWLAGVEQATVCLDPEAAAARRVTLADGATMVVVYALGQRGAAALARLATAAGAGAALAEISARTAIGLGVGLAAGVYLVRRRSAAGGPGPVLGHPTSAGLALGAGALTGLVLAAFGTASLGPEAAGARLLSHARFIGPGEAAIVIVALLGEEVMFRGVIQRGLAELLARRASGRTVWGQRLMAATGSVVVALVATRLAGVTGTVADASVAARLAWPLGLASAVAVQVMAALVRAVTGRAAAAWLARIVALLAAAFTAGAVRLP
jgi:hypothetical protein